ncbi:MAG TPA: SsrA-binding protein SmpB [Acidimicrobiia bacterium]|jgi:SsrA-binding protein|nr:SsrA-binding protein SmpB [Acidimicrobiia bacterium]
MPKSADAGARDRVAISNRRARHEYFVLDTYECGLALVGSEVKSIRDGRANLSDAYARIDNGEVWLYGMHVSPYPFSRDNPDPDRKRKLLLHRAEIDRLVGKLNEPGLTLVPLKVFFQNGKAKIELAVARGKRQWDKRQAMAERDAKRETERAVRTRNRGGE